MSQVVTLSKSELEFLLGDTRAISAQAKMELDAKFRIALKREQVKLPPAWRTEVHERIARGEHQVFPPEVAKGVTKPKARTKAQERAFAKWRNSELEVDASALKADDILSLMDI